MNFATSLARLCPVLLCLELNFSLLLQGGILQNFLFAASAVKSIVLHEKLENWKVAQKLGYIVLEIVVGQN